MLSFYSCSVILNPLFSVDLTLRCLGASLRLPNMSLLILEPAWAGLMVRLRRSETLIIDDSISVSKWESQIVLERTEWSASVNAVAASLNLADLYRDLYEFDFARLDGVVRYFMSSCVIVIKVESCLIIELAVVTEIFGTFGFFYVYIIESLKF